MCSSLRPLKKQPKIAIGLLIGCAIIARLPFIYNIGVDESFYLVAGRQWLAGFAPYANAFDVKPPLLFALMAAAEAVFGASLLAAKILTMTAVSATASGLYLIGRNFSGDMAGGTAGLLYICSTLSLGGTFSPAELLMAPFTTFGMLAGLKAARNRPHGPHPRRLFAAGVCFGAAACVKQTALFEALSLFLFLYYYADAKARIKIAIIFGAGFCAVPLTIGLYFLCQGHLAALVGDVLFAAAGRGGAAYMPWSQALVNLGLELLFLLPLIVMAALTLLQPIGCRARGFLTLWAACALTGVLLARSMFFIYFLPVVQPLCLAAGLFYHRRLTILHEKAVPAFAGIALPITVIGYLLAGALPLMFAGRDNWDEARSAAQAMEVAERTPGDRLLVADRDMVLYLASGLNPPATVFHPMHLLCDFPAPGLANALEQSLALRPAFIATADPAFTRPCENPRKRAYLAMILLRDYCVLGRFGSTLTGERGGSTVLYALREKFGSRCLPRHSEADFPAKL